MTKCEYNGWWNYETWLVKLWIDNEEHSQRHFAECAKRALDLAWKNPEAGFTAKEIATAKLAKAIEVAHEDALPELANGFATDLLSAAMSEVNWLEIAGHLINNAVAETAVLS